MRHRVLAGAIVVSLACAARLSGCTLAPRAGSETVQTATAHALLWGLDDVSAPEASTLCGDQRVIEMRSGMDAATVAANWLTLGLYAPVRVQITCERA